MGKKGRRKRNSDSAKAEPSIRDKNGISELVDSLGLTLTSSAQDLMGTLSEVLKTEDDEVSSHLDKDRKCLDAVKVKYCLKGKREWWWVFEDSLDCVGRLLERDGYAIVDNFFDTKLLREDVGRMYNCGRLDQKGTLIDGRDGKNTSYGNLEVRGDWIGWFDGDESGWTNEGSLKDYLLKVSTFVSQLKGHIKCNDSKGLDDIATRSRCMVTCYPPSSRYTKHVDNGGGISNGRRLTALIYMNEGWKGCDGGELAIYERGGKRRKITVEPIAERLVVFWSDERVPHEVLESKKDRFTVTIWFFDGPEWEEAKRLGIIPKPTPTGDHDNDNVPGTTGTSNSTNNGDDDVRSGGAHNQAKLSFVSESDHAAREPDGSELRDVIVTNQPFCEVGEEPTLENLNIKSVCTVRNGPPQKNDVGVLRDANGLLAPRGDVNCNPSCHVKTSSTVNIEESGDDDHDGITYAVTSSSSSYEVLLKIPERCDLADTVIDADLKKGVLVVENGTERVEVGCMEDADWEKVKAKFKKKIGAVKVTVQKASKPHVNI